MYKMLIQAIIALGFILYDYSRAESFNLKNFFIALYDQIFHLVFDFSVFFFNFLYNLPFIIFEQTKFFFSNKENYLYIVSIIIYYFLFTKFLNCLSLKKKVILLKFWEINYFYKFIILLFSLLLICFFKFVLVKILIYFKFL